MDIHAEHPLDILSVLLRGVRLRGEDVYCCNPSSPFAIAFDGSTGVLHIVNQGEFAMQVDGQPEVRHYHRGDVLLLPGGARHTIRRGEGAAPRPLSEFSSLNGVVTEGEGTRWLTGTFTFDHHRRADLLRSLPPVIELRGAGSRSLLWLDISTQMLMLEISQPSQGSREMISRILDLLFIQVLRAWATSSSAEPGWLTGVMDPAIGGAILEIHRDPSHPWTIERLAQKSNLSRSAFADRFTRRVGQAPGAYVASLRLNNAADLLLDTTEPVSSVANRNGYDSEAAFSRAFSQRFGMAPSRWRRQNGLQTLSPTQGA